MSHWSENCNRLRIRSLQVTDLRRLVKVGLRSGPAVYFLWFPPGRGDADASNSDKAFQLLASFFAGLHERSTVCILTTPPDAARLLPHLEAALQFQLWVAVKLSPNTYPTARGGLPQRHAALLVLTRYRDALRHTKTRIRYTYCPACGKTTKDYGGKKHLYHEYGTLVSDVWRDIECDPHHNTKPLVDRLRDLFGLEPYKTLHLLDMRLCSKFAPGHTPISAHESRLPFGRHGPAIPMESRLVNGDCLKLLRTLPDNSADFCFADPPYNLKKKYDHWNDTLESVEYFKWCDEWLAELGRVLKPGRTLAVMNIPLWAARHYRYLCSVLDFQSWIAWDALSFPVRMVMPAHYVILCFSKGKPRLLPGISDATVTPQDKEALTPPAEFFCVRPSCITQRRMRRVSDEGEIGDLWYDIHRLKHNSRRVDHPCQLPPKLMRRLFALFTRPRELVLDCFNGAGTSTLIAHQMGRRFIGVEISAQYHQIALERHEQISRGENPFGKRKRVPNVKNSPVERLPKQTYAVSKKVLQLDVRRIACQIGRLPKREEVKTLSTFPIEFFDRYFISWGEVCAAARTTGMSELPAGAMEETFRQGYLFSRKKSRKHKT